MVSVVGWMLRRVKGQCWAWCVSVWDAVCAGSPVVRVRNMELK